MSSTPLGRVSGEVATAFAWLHSPAQIHAEIETLEAAIRAGDTGEATRVLLADWRRVRDAQRRLVGKAGEEAG